MPPSPRELQARRSRVSRIRRRVAGGAVALFALGSGAIALQLATGHDPALDGATAAAAPASRHSSVPSTFDRDHRTWYPGGDGESGPSASGAGGGSSASGGAPGSPGPSAGQVAPLTTGQS